MDPAFASPRQALAFAGLLLVILVAPAPSSLPARYARIPVKLGEFAYVDAQVFQERAPAEMVFLGSSEMWGGIDTPAVAARIAGPVFTLGWPWSGYDAVYVVAKDLLEHRAVNTLVVYDEPRARDSPHLHSAQWWRAGLPTAGLPWADRLGLYGGAVLGLPRRLLGEARADLTHAPGREPPDFWTETYRSPQPNTRLGSLAVRRNFHFDASYQPWQPPQRGPAAVTYATASGDFDFSTAAPLPYRDHFFRLIVELCRAHHTKLLIVHMPDLSEHDDAKIVMRQDFTERAGPVVHFAGVRPATFFQGLDQAALTRLYYQERHLNESGARDFTRLLLPALVEAHALPSP